MEMTTHTNARLRIRYYRNNSEIENLRNKDHAKITESIVKIFFRLNCIYILTHQCILETPKLVP